jgi:integrase
MNGHLVRPRGKRKDAWSIVLETGTDTDGKRKQKWITFHGTSAEARAELRRLLHDAEHGVPVDSSNLTLGAFLDTWLATYAKSSVTPKTYERYEDHIRLHIAPAIGHIPLSKLTPMHVENFYATCRVGGRLDGREGGLSERTLLHMHSVLNLALKCGVRWRVLARNPLEGVTRPKPRSTEMKFLSAAEASQLLELAKTTPHYVLLSTALGTGMRRGELLALKWQDFDLDTKAVFVQRSLEQTRGGTLRFKEPKTRRGRRRIDLPSSLVETLRRHKASQARQRLLLGSEYHDEDLVFSKAFGSPIPPDNITGFFRQFAANAGHQGLRFHDLRHTHATILLQQNVPAKVVSERLGHSSIAITLDTYSHVLPTMQDDAARCLDDALWNVAG